MANEIKFAGKESLQAFFNNLKNVFSTISHKHTISDITDYSVDSALSSTSTKPVQNKVINEKFDAITELIDGKADDGHNHDSDYDSKGAAEAVGNDLGEHTGNTDIHFSASERTKLENIEAGAQVNSITGIKGDTESTYRTGNVNITPSNIGLGNVDNTSDANKPVSTAQQSAIDTALNTAKGYTDTKTNGLASETVVDNKISAHNTSDAAHNDIRGLISELSTAVNNFLDVDDTTTDQLSEVLTLINNNKGTLESLTNGKINVSAIVNNLTTNDSSKVLSSAQGVALKGLIDTLQGVVDGKADEEHGHDISDITNLQTTLNAKATQSSLDSHTSDTTKHITSTERTNWNAAKTHADSAHVTGIKGNSESTYRTGNVNITPANIGLGNVNNTSDANKPVSTAQRTAIDTALGEAKSYTDTKASGFYTKSEIDNHSFITVDEIDAICSANIVAATANEVTF